MLQPKVILFLLMLKAKLNVHIFFKQYATYRKSLTNEFKTRKIQGSRNPISIQPQSLEFTKKYMQLSLIMVSMRHVGHKSLALPNYVRADNFVARGHLLKSRQSTIVKKFPKIMISIIESRKQQD